MIRGKGVDKDHASRRQACWSPRTSPRSAARGSLSTGPTSEPMRSCGTTRYGRPPPWAAARVAAGSRSPRRGPRTRTAWGCPVMHARLRTCPRRPRTFPAGRSRSAAPGTIGGSTTGSAPLVTAAMAVRSADQQRHHHPPIGPANGLFSYLRRARSSTSAAPTATRRSCGDSGRGAATTSPATSARPSSRRWRRPSWSRAAARERRRPRSPGARRERRRPALDARVKRLAAADDGVVASPRPMISRVG